MRRLLAQTSLQARTRNAMFATVDTNRKIGIPMRLMSTIAYERKPPLSANRKLRGNDFPRASRSSTRTVGFRLAISR